MEAKQTGEGPLQLRYQHIYDLTCDCKHKQKTPFICVYYDLGLCLMSHIKAAVAH